MASLGRAIALARALDAELHVVTIVPERTLLNPLFPQLNVLEAVRAVERTRRAVHATRAWLELLPGDDWKAALLHVRSGKFVEEAAELAHELGAELIVMPPLARPFGATVTALARAAGVPVLVARAATSEDTIVAATDLRDPSYPVIRAAVRLAVGLEVAIVAVHSAPPSSAFVGLDTDARDAEPVADAPTADGRRRLERAATWPGLFAEAVVANDANPVEAILREARARDADLIVVGSRPRSWLSRLFGGSVATEVVDRARRSVLVAPLEA